MSWVALGAAMVVASVRAEETFGEAMKRAATDYTERTRVAAAELQQARARVAAAKVPLLEQLRAAEDQLIALEREVVRLGTDHEQFESDRRKTIQEFDARRKQAAYLASLAQESLKSATEARSPGEEQLHASRWTDLQAGLDDTADGPNTRAALETVAFLLQRTAVASGGATFAGRATLAADSQVVPGTFALVGPEVFFRPDSGGPGAMVRRREGSLYPVAYPLATWRAEEAAAFFGGQMAPLPVDASGGKALRLAQVGGSVAEHIHKGGVVAYAILVVGAFALLLVISKLRDVVQMRLAAANALAATLAALARGDRASAEASLPTLAPTTRELVEAGLRHADEPRLVVEDRLNAVLLGQRLHFERRLPLLAVIATAAPLMGLLGTVVGMVKTFALITVFGTGNAGKLSSGISEVLVATELGLAVAIPSLVAHGFRANQIHKNLALLDRQALEIVTAIELGRVAGPEAGRAPLVSA